MPTKTRPHYSDNRYQYTDYQSGSGNPIPVGSIIKVGDNSVTTSGPVSDYIRKIATGQNATSALSGTAWETESELATCEYKLAYVNPNNGSSTWRYRLTGNMMSYFLWTMGGGASSNLTTASSFVTLADNQARTKFYQRLAETQSQFKGAVFSGELRESLNMIRNPARSLRSGINDYLDRLKKGGPRRAKKDRPKFVRDTWLEYSFGWKPLVADLEEGITAFYKSKWPKPVFQMVRSRGSHGTQPKLSSQYSVAAGVVPVKLRWSPQVNSTAEVKYYGVYRSTGTGPSSFAHFGFTPWEFVPTVWELIPYSFLVDYFTNIGDILSAWSYRNIGCEWAAKGVKLTNRVEIRNAQIVNDDPNTYKFIYNMGTPGSSASLYTQRSRDPSVSIPLPAFELQVPGMGLKWINIAALSKNLSSTRRSLAS